MKHTLKRFLQPEVAVKETARIFRAELDQKINVAARRIKSTIGRRAKHIQTLHAKAVAQFGNFGAVLFDEADHGAGSCRDYAANTPPAGLSAVVVVKPMARVQKSFCA